MHYFLSLIQLPLKFKRITFIVQVERILFELRYIIFIKIYVEDSRFINPASISTKDA